MKISEKAAAKLAEVIEIITSPERLPVTIKKALFKLPDDAPASKWSFSNRFMVAAQGNPDSRGFKQWQSVGRKVKKGCLASYILGPRMVKERDEKTGTEEQKCIGFFTIPVFGYDNTEGEELPYRAEMNEYMKHFEAIPLYDLAKSLDLSVVIDTTEKGEYGSYDGQEIRICTDSEQTFYHELSHAIDDKLGNLPHMGVTDADVQIAEIVAELSACYLARTYGTQANLAYTQRYIRNWSGGVENCLSKITKALERVYQIISYCEQYAETTKEATA